MPFSNDRDLLHIEPNIFRDVPFLSQMRLTAADAVIAGATLTSASSDFEAAQVDAGSVILIGETTLEVVSRNSPSMLTVSQPRLNTTDNPIPPAPGTALTITVRTFAPQAALVCAALLRVLGIDPDDANAPFNEQSIVSTLVMRRLEALGTLERVYSAAFALAGDNTAVHEKARQYRRRFHAACSSASVLLDVNGDGQPDTRRHLGITRFVRM